MTTTATTTNPIRTAVLPLKADAIARAGEEAREVIKFAGRVLEEAGFDLLVAAPRPHGSMSRQQYMAAQSRCSFFSSICRWRQVTYRANEPMLADLDAERCQKFVEAVKQDAAVEYDAFVAKLTEKIGVCVSASLSGNHVWSHSLLTVTKADGSSESWKTRMIVNRSCLGKLFNQFPTRRVGGTKEGR